MEKVEVDRQSLLRSAGVPDLIEQIALRAEPKTALYLRNLLLDRREATRSAAASALAEALATLSPHDWVWFDDMNRSGYLGSRALHSGSWNTIEPIRFRRLVDGMARPGPAVTLGLCHGNGYVREMALVLAALHRVASTLPLVLLRLRDWVPEVRAAAAKAWEALLPDASDEDLLSVVPLLQRLLDLEPTSELRVGERMFKARVENESGRLLIAGLDHSEVTTRRYAYSSLAALGFLSSEALFEKAVRDADPRIQEWSVSFTVASMPPATTVMFLRRAATVPRTRVRLEALRALWGVEESACRDLLEDALLSPAASIREFACWALERLGSFEPAAYYRSAIKETAGRALSGAITALGRYGSSTDAGSIAEFFDSTRSPRIRAAALRSTFRLDPSVSRPLYEAGLKDESARVARVARDLISADRSYPACEEARRWLREASTARAKLYALTIGLRRCAKWNRIIFLLEVLLEGHEPLRLPARRGLETWLEKSNRSVARPTDDQRQRLNWLLTRCKALLPERMLRELRFTFE